MTNIIQLPRDMSEKDLQTSVIAIAELNGWKVCHFADSRKQIGAGRFVGDKRAAGFPDLVLARDRMVFMELKRERGKLTIAQIEWKHAIERSGGEHHIIMPTHLRDGSVERILKRTGAK